MTLALTRAATIAAAIICAGASSAEPMTGSPDSNRPAADAPAPPAGQADVTTLLFSGSQWKGAPTGTVITYSYAKKVTDASFGPSFDDHMVLTLEPGDDPASRTVQVKMFSGTNAKPAGPFRSTEQNPALLLVLEENVQEMSRAFKANPRYLKNAIRKAWREKPSIAPVSIDVGGKQVQGTRITVQPFLGDPEADRMKGLETIVYVVDVSDAVPGYLAAVDIHVPTKDAAVKDASTKDLSTKDLSTKDATTKEAPTKGATTFSEQLNYQATKQP